MTPFHCSQTNFPLSKSLFSNFVNNSVKILSNAEPGKPHPFGRDMFRHHNDFNFITISCYHELALGCTVFRDMLYRRAWMCGNARGRQHRTSPVICFNSGKFICDHKSCASLIQRHFHNRVRRHTRCFQYLGLSPS